MSRKSFRSHRLVHFVKNRIRCWQARRRSGRAYLAPYSVLPITFIGLMANFDAETEGSTIPSSPTSVLPGGGSAPPKA
jgi:hypothetical protein